MKKNSLLKAMIAAFIVYVVLSWIIPVGYFSGTDLTTSGTEPVGLVDLIKYPLTTAVTSVFSLIVLVVLLIGGFYGVLNKTGAYSEFVEKVASKFKGKEKRFLIISILVFAILTSLTALELPILILVPFFITVILLLGYDKLVAFLSTFGAILVGNMGSTYGFNINGYISYFLSVDINKFIVWRAILFLIITILYIVIVVKISKGRLGNTTLNTKKKKKAEKSEASDNLELEIPFYEKSSGVKNKKSAIPMISLFIVIFIVTLIGMYNWTTGLEITFFDDIYESIISFKIGGNSVFQYLMGATVDSLGYWTNYDLAVAIVVMTLLISWLYSISIKDTLSAFKDGMKKMLPVAGYVILANVIFLVANSSTTGYNFYPTIADKILGLTKHYNIATMGVTAIVGGFMFNDFPYMLNMLYSYISSAYGKNLEIVGLTLQAFHGLVMFLLPTSVYMVIGLKYLELPYKEYLKNIWKYLLIALIAIIAVLGVICFI